MLHQLGNWSSKAAAGVTASCLLSVWAVIGVVTGFPPWWQVALYSTTSGVTVVMVFAIRHRASGAISWSFNASSMTWCGPGRMPTTG